jgi:hypothetical protein
VPEDTKGHSRVSQDSCDNEREPSLPPSPIIETPDSQDTHSVPETQRGKPKHSRLKTLTCLNVTFNGILAFTTILLMISAVYQAWLMNRQWDTMERTLEMSDKTMKIDERAWVTPKEAKIRLPIAAGLVPMIRVVYQNTGRSPSRETKVRHSITVLMANRIPNEKMPDMQSVADDETIALIGPQVTHRTEVLLKRPLTEKDIAHLNSKEWLLMTYGLVTYLDIFDIKHETTFCFIVRDLYEEDLSPCDKWNDAN